MFGVACVRALPRAAVIFTWVYPGFKKMLASHFYALGWLPVEFFKVLVRSAVKKGNFPHLLRVPKSSSCVLFSTLVQCQNFASKLFYCLQDWRCVKYRNLVSLRNKSQCINLRTSLLWLTQPSKERNVQVWIVAKEWKRSQAGRFLTSWPRSYSVFYHFCWSSSALFVEAFIFKVSFHRVKTKLSKLTFCYIFQQKHFL